MSAGSRLRLETIGVITGLDMMSAYLSAMEAARNAETVDETKGRIRNCLPVRSRPRRSLSRRGWIDAGPELGTAGHCF